MKQKICIEKLLKWAYCEELPKADEWEANVVPSGWSSVETFVQLLTKIDENAYGVVPSLQGDQDPHADALRVHAAVASLSELVLDFPDSWNPMPEIAVHEKHCAMALSAARFGIANSARRPFELVRKHAILGGCPDWEGSVPELKPVMNGNGQPIWFQLRVEHAIDGNGRAVERKHETEDGWNRNTKAPKAGAYQKFYFSPDPVPVLIGRGEYQLWWSHLNVLVDKLAETLEKWDVQPTQRPAEPWAETDGERVARTPTIHAAL